MSMNHNQRQIDLRIFARAEVTVWQFAHESALLDSTSFNCNFRTSLHGRGTAQSRKLIVPFPIEAIGMVTLFGPILNMPRARKVPPGYASMQQRSSWKRQNLDLSGDWYSISTWDIGTKSAFESAAALGIPIIVSEQEMEGYSATSKYAFAPQNEDDFAIMRGWGACHGIEIDSASRVSSLPPTPNELRPLLMWRNGALGEYVAVE